MFSYFGSLLAALNIFFTTLVETILFLLLQSESDYDGWLQMRLSHSFDDEPVPNFIERGNISISSIRVGAANIVQIGLQDSQLSQLKDLAQNGGKYRLKAVVRTSSGSETNFLTSVLAVIFI